MAVDTLLHRRDEDRRRRRLALYDETRARLRTALAELAPGHPVWIFGSLTQPGRFNDWSDIDLALEREPPSISVGQLAAVAREQGVELPPRNEPGTAPVP